MNSMLALGYITSSRPTWILSQKTAKQTKKEKKEVV
jgi:hypothetical protein